MRLKCLSLALCLLPGASIAQSQATCSSSLSVVPANPIFGQQITFNYTFQSTLAPSSQVPPYQAYAYLTEPGSPTPSLVPAEIFPTNTPQTLTESFYPLGPGQITLTVSPQAVPDGLQPLCSNGLPPQTAVIPVVPVGPSGQNGNLLAGQYAFQFNGLNPQVQGASQRLAAVGSFTADGQGHVTGVEDVNSGGGSNVQIPVTGQYTLGGGGYGTLSLTTTLGVQQLDFYVPAGQLATGVTSASIVSTDGYVLFGNGTLAKQTVPAQPATLDTYYAFTLSGDFPCSTTCRTGEPVFESGSIDIDPYGGFDGFLEGSVGAVLLPRTAVSGTFGGNAATTGRFVYTLSQGPFPALHMVGYPVDATHFFTISTDSHAKTYLLSGTGIQ